MRKPILRPTWLIFVLILLSITLLSLGPGYAYVDRGLAHPQAGSVIVAPGNPIQIAVAYSNVIPGTDDLHIAVQMAITDYGTIKGFSAQGNLHDTGCDGTAAAAEAANIVANTQNVGVIGPFCSSSTVGALPVFESAGLVMISPSNTGDPLYDFGPGVFNRVIPADPIFDGWDVWVSGLPSVQSWEADFETTAGHPPMVFAKYSYDAAMLLLTRLDQVSSVDGGGNLVIYRYALANAVRITDGLQGITGKITLDPFGTRVSDFHAPVWMDDFSAASLDDNWTWIDEDPSNWSLTANPGYLRIITQSPTQNRLVQELPEGDFEIRTRVVFTPTEDYQFAGLSVFADNENALNFGRAYCSTPAPDCLGNAIYYDFVVNGVVTFNDVMTTTLQNEAHLLMKLEGGVYTGYVSTDGVVWEEVGSHTPSFTPQYIGLYASGQTSTSEIPADFDYFTLTAPNEMIYLPLMVN
jgi:hypothetical protein